MPDHQCRFHEPPGVHTLFWFDIVLLPPGGQEVKQ
jgi:hypothetical protein